MLLPKAGKERLQRGIEAQHATTVDQDSQGKDELIIE